MKKLFLVTAVVESATGILFLISPPLPVSILFDSSINDPVGLLAARLAGAAILSLGVACWLVSKDEKSRVAKGLAAAMLLYNIAAIVLLVYAGLGAHLSGIGLWPAVVMHIVMALWCIKYISVKTLVA